MYSAPPTRFALGVGVVGRRLTLELDLALGLPLQPALSASVDVRSRTIGDMAVEVEAQQEEYEIESHVTLNPSAGFEYFLSPGLSLLGGLSVNFTALPPLSPVSSVGNIVQARASHVTGSSASARTGTVESCCSDSNSTMAGARRSPSILTFSRTISQSSIRIPMRSRSSSRARLRSPRSCTWSNRSRTETKARSKTRSKRRSTGVSSRSRRAPNPLAEPMKGKPKPTDDEQERKEKQEP